MPPRKPAAGGSAASGKALIGLLGLAVGLAVGYGAGRVSTGTPINPLSNPKGGYQEGYEAAHRKLLDSGLVPPTPGEILSLTGTVKSNAGGTLTVDVAYRSPDPLDESVIPTTRTVTLAADAKIFEIVPKDQATFAAEMAEFQQNPQEQAAPPQPFTRTELQLSDLQPGDSVTIYAETDILRATAIVAAEIQRNPAPSQQGGPAVLPPPTPPPQPAPAQ